MTNSANLPGVKEIAVTEEPNEGSPSEPSIPPLETPTGEDVSRVLRVESSPEPKWWRYKWWIVGALVLGVAALLLLRFFGGRGETTQFRTETVERGNLTILVTATGALEPTNEVEVGSELSGIIDSVYVDYNSSVRAGQALAKLNTSKLDAQAQQLRASVEASRARVLEAEATLEESRLSLTRSQELFAQQLVPQSNLDAAQAAFKRAEASLASAKAQVLQSEASLSTVETDLTKAIIRSPVDGVVLVRNVERGQTVAASLQAPVLFTIAQDLREMELHVDIDEADVSRVQPGQDVSFTVDAYPERTFPATIREVRYASKTVEGVVTYEAVLDVSNADLLLRPGMTATADITVEKVEDALLVPNAALRFTPANVTSARTRDNGGLVGMILPRPRFRRPEGANETPRPPRGVMRRVWTLENGVPVAIPIAIGSTDGTRTVVTSGDVSPGLELLVDTVGSPNAS